MAGAACDDTGEIDAEIGRHPRLVVGPCCREDFEIGDEVACRVIVADRDQAHQMVKGREDERRVGTPGSREDVQFVPAMANLDTFLLQPPQQRAGIGDVAEIIRRPGADLGVIKRENRLVPASLEMEKPEMPGEMEGEVVAA